MTTTFHRRTRLHIGPKGMRWRKVGADKTLCGAPVTDHDAGYGDRAIDWIDMETGQPFSLCPDCRRLK